MPLESGRDPRLDGSAKGVQAFGVLPVFVSHLVLAAAVAQEGEGSPAVASAMRVLSEARWRCDWEATIERAREVKRLVRRGSDAWFEAAGYETLSWTELWRPDEIERTAREALDVLADARRAEPDARRSALGPLVPRTAQFAVGVELQLAHVLQGRGLHVEALGHLRFVLDDLASGPCEGSAELMGSAGLDAARSLIVLGRTREARTALASLLGNFPGSRAAAGASVLLQAGPDGIGAYRGKYAGDEEQTRRMRAIRDVVPRVRARVVERLGWKLAELPEFPLGFVDLPSDWRELGALADGDARRPNFAPLVMVFSEPLALDLLDLETVLVHEFTHAALIGALGPTYHRLPFWLCEGLSEAVAGQIEPNMDVLLANLLLDDARAFVSTEPRKLMPIAFEEAPCARSGTPGQGLAILPLVESRGIEGVRALIARLREGRTLDDAFRTVMERDVSAYLELARERVREAIEKRHRPARSVAQSVLTAEAAGPASVLSLAEDVLPALPPGIARGFVLYKRAGALESLHRLEEALDAWRALHAARREHPSYVELSRIGEARTLLALGRRDEGVRALSALARDAMTPAAGRWASAELTRQR